MSGIAGIFHLDGSPVDISALHRMGEALAWRGPDGIAYWHSGPVGFAHAQFWTTPESLDERQPLCSPDGNLCLTFDGRIDNREEIIPSLRSRRAEPVDETDPGLLLAAYRLWGTDCPQHIAGDFAFALWDQAKRTLWCARDHIGIRPFYYVKGPRWFLFSSDVQSLLTNPGVSLAVNEGMVAEYLADAVTSRDETLYRDIQRLPSSSTLTLTCDGKFQFATWWRPDFSLIDYRTDAEYAEHFTHMMEQSVSARMRVHGGWACQLSGGLDSSTVAVTAQTLLDRSGSGKRVQTFSTVAPGKSWDESGYISETATFAHLDSARLPPLELDLDFYAEAAAQSRDFPGYPNAAPLFGGIYDTAQMRGTRVILAGQGGNHLLEGQLSHLMDFAASGSFLQLFRFGRDDYKMYGGKRGLPVFLARTLLLQAAPRSLLLFREARRLRRSTVLSGEFMGRTSLAARTQAVPRPEIRDFVSHAQSSVFHILQSGDTARWLEHIDYLTKRFGVEERQPFFDRRVIEFCLRIPEGQRQQGLFGKWVLRTAMRGRLPGTVLTRRIQAEFSELYSDALSTPLALKAAQTLRIKDRTDWLDSVKLSNQLRQLTSSKAIDSWLVGSIWMVLAVDLWFRSLLEGSP